MNNPGSTAQTMINFVLFVARDGLSWREAWGKFGAPTKAFRGLRSPLLLQGTEDERPTPKEGDEDFTSRTREYVFAGLQEEPGRVIVAVYNEV